MTQWYVKELSKLTAVSVQTLHHYDRISLLIPSIRLANGYRLYDEKDLLRLQQVIALKYFGFRLSKIKTLLNKKIDIMDHFSVQAQFLEEKAKTLFEASQILKNITSNSGNVKTIPWETIIQSIEVYRLTQRLEKTWAAKIFTAEELKEYAHFQQELSRYTESERKSITRGWKDIISQVNAHANHDPTSDIAMEIGKRCVDWANALYGKKYVKMRHIIWEQGLKKGQIDHEDALSPESFAWLNKAIDAYSKNRIYKILSQIKVLSSDIVVKQWEELLIELYGDEQALKDEYIKAMIKDDKISKIAKDWLKQISKKQKGIIK